MRFVGLHSKERGTTMRGRPTVGLVIALGIVGLLTEPVAAQQKPGAATASQVCASCHGPQGNSISPAFPKLAGQQKEYLEAQLKAFRDHTRADPMAQGFMWGMASQLSDQSIADLAAYFSSQKPTIGKPPDAKLAQAGRDIFTRGIPGANVAPCLTCHGPRGEGNGIIPRLADQHQEYVLKQLALFKTQVRADANSPLMHTVTGGMTFDQMAAVAAFVSRIE
jgi:cytochrome c553